MVNIILKNKRDKSSLLHHPWIFSGAVEKTEGNPDSGDVVRVLDSKGGFIAWGHWSSNSQISVRLLDWDENAKIDESWWEEKISCAVESRQRLFAGKDTNAYRLIFSEADMMPGLIVDQYADTLVLQALTQGAEKIKKMAAEILCRKLNINKVFERSDAEVRKLEGLPIISKELIGEPGKGLIEIKENGHRFFVEIAEGQKTGFFLDQRENRKITAMYSKGKTVLDCFSHTGGFSVYSAYAGAESVVVLDSSKEALSLAQKNIELNKSGCHPEFVCGNAFQVLREYRNTGREFDMIILDPPKLAPTRHAVKKASRAYKDINLLAMKLIKSGGILATFSCSGGISMEYFKEILFWSSRDAGREVQILTQLSQPQDHPIRLSFPESEYLKGLILRIL